MMGGERELKDYCLIGGAPVWDIRNILKMEGLVHNFNTGLYS